MSTAESTKPAAVPPPPALRDGQHDFDWKIGTWRSHISRLRKPLTGSTTWDETNSVTVVRTLLNGRANMAEVISDGPNGRSQLIALRLYDPVAHEWTLSFAVPEGGGLGTPPMIGRFQDGRGVFLDQETYNGRTILVRFSFEPVSPTVARTLQEFSADQGKTWEPNHRTAYTRMTQSDAARWSAQRDAADAAAGQAPAERDGRHDFDFDVGTWKTHISRRQHPLTGSTTWTEYDGTSVVRKLLNGSASLVELAVDGPAGHLDGIGLRLYNAGSHQWSLNWVNGAQGTLNVPTIGQFKDGRGEFFDQEMLDGRAILVRNIWSDITPSSHKFEQAFSADGGQTWEANWLATYTRTKPPSGKGS